MIRARDRSRVRNVRHRTIARGRVGLGPGEFFGPDFRPPRLPGSRRTAGFAGRASDHSSKEPRTGWRQVIEKWPRCRSRRGTRQWRWWKRGLELAQQGSNHPTISTQSAPCLASTSFAIRDALQPRSTCVALNGSNSRSARPISGESSVFGTTGWLFPSADHLRWTSSWSRCVRGAARTGGTAWQ